MKRQMLSLALASLFASRIDAQSYVSQPYQAPTLEGTVGVGVGVGAQRYNGTFGDQGSVYGRGILTYHPLEWLGTRFTGGIGNINNDNQMGVDFQTDWLSNLGLDLVLQPQIGLGPMRPYIASGLSTTFGTAKINGFQSRDLDWNLYVPVEFGLEFLIADNLSMWAWGESYAYMQDWEKLDGVASKGDYYERRDDLQKVGIGFSFLIGSNSDEDKDGVTGSIDQCPGTPATVKVDRKGCPFDGDMDGTPDYKDLCPTTTPGVSVDVFGCALDSDKDGVIDAKDKCSITPVGVKVDVNGCPALVDADKDGVSDEIDKCPGSSAGLVVNEVGCALDSDRDGIGDDLDQCPGSEVGAKVDARGCILPLADADRDGIGDAIDKCPGTRVGTKVDADGCPLLVIIKGAKLVIDGIVFKTGSAVIDEVSAPVLARAAVAISKAPGAKIEVAGFTDNVGSDRSNQKLSERRAASVKAYLVKSGVPSTQLSAKGYGEADPVVDNSTADNRSENRRIEFHVK